MTSKAKRSRREFTEDEINRTLEAGVEGADNERSRSFERLRLLQAARIRGRDRQLRRLAARTGGAPDTQIQVVLTKVEQDRRLEKALGMEAARSSIPPIVPDAERWTLHGHVVDQSLDPLKGMTVSLVDPKGQRVRTQGGPTNASGYFKLSVQAAPEEAGEEPPTPPKVSGQARRGGEGAFVRVMAGRSKLLFEGDAPLIPVGGAVEYLEVLVGEEGKGSERGPRDSRRSIPRPAGP